MCYKRLLWVMWYLQFTAVIAILTTLSASFLALMNYLCLGALIKFFHRLTVTKSRFVFAIDICFNIDIKSNSSEILGIYSTNGLENNPNKCVMYLTRCSCNFYVYHWNCNDQKHFHYREIPNHFQTLLLTHPETHKNYQ